VKAVLKAFVRQRKKSEARRIGGMKFDWQRWGIDLNDVTFANA
jgi:hypothetical protein